MQELMIYAGQMDCYENCNEVIDKFLTIEVSSLQVHRVTDTYGAEAGKTVNEHTTLTPLKKEETLYIEADGSMLLTREESWKEVKPGRIFKASDYIYATGKPGWISNLQYVAHLGGYKKFMDQMECLIDSYSYCRSKLIFITDGAPWLKNWIEDAYPESRSIQGYYHVCQYLHDFSREHFTDKTTEQQWVNRQKKLLPESPVEEVIQNIQALSSKKKEAKKLIEYCQANQERMDYRQYREMGCGIIGSGAIESAHRKVIQKRMK